MNYNFIKPKLREMINGTRVDEAALGVFLSGQENSFILNHNKDAIREILKFLNTPENNIFILNGFMGSGKTYVADFILDFISDEVLIFRNSYQEAINPDDVLLSLFKDFSVYHNEKKTVLPKIETNIFSEKINAYIKSCSAPMLFIFDSFEINMKSKATQKDIIDFINYLSHFEKVKIIICSRTFKTYDLISPLGCTDYSLKSLSKEESDLYFQKNNISGSDYEFEELLKVTRGHYLLFELSALIINLLGMSLTLFLNEYTKSSKNFLEYLLSKLLGTTSDKFLKLLLFLALIRHGVDTEFIITQNIASYDDIEFLLQKKLISEKFGKYYLKDYFKKEYIKTVSAATKIKVHNFIIELYENELPLKPFERVLFLSRQTMRQEIKHHRERIDELNEELERTGKQRILDTQDFNYLTYSKASGFDPQVKNSTASSKRTSGKYRKNQLKIKNETLTDLDAKLLHITPSHPQLEKDLADITNLTEHEINNALSSDDDDDKIPDTLDDYLNLGKNYEDAFNFTNAILYYKKALKYRDDVSFEEKEPLIYQKLAICHKKIHDIEEAEKYFEKTFLLYSYIKSQKANEILLELAKMYAEAYKFEKAKEVYTRILYSPIETTLEVNIRVYIDLAELEDNNRNPQLALSYMQKALVEAEKYHDIKLLTECYFKYAIMYDDADNIELAVKYYLRCVQTSNNPKENQFVSVAYSNLAEISLFRKNVAAAKMYYELAIDADKKQNNIEGLFHSYQKLSKLYEDENPEKTYDLLTKALSAAKKFDDIRYAITVYVEIGDYYIKNEEYKRGIKSYIMAKTLTPKHSEEELNRKISNKINKVKSMLGEDRFLTLVDEIKKKK